MRCCGWVAGCAVLAVVAVIAIGIGAFWFMGHAMKTAVRSVMNGVRATPSGLAIENESTTAMTNVRIAVGARSAGKTPATGRFTTTIPSIAGGQSTTIPWRSFKAPNGHSLNTKVFRVESYDVRYQFGRGLGSGQESGTF